MQPNSSLWSRLRGFRNAPPPPRRPDAPARCTHVVLLDGTMSSLARGEETNIGLIYRLLSEMGADAHTTLYYEPGIQWRGVRRGAEVMAGVGINRQIRRAYLFLARNYRPGDRIFLFGFSRGAFAVRSLAGLIDKLGLLRSAQISEDILDRVYRLYREKPDGPDAQALRETRSHARVDVAFLGAFDTVRALGLRLPLLWRLAPVVHGFHSHDLGRCTQVGRHALAMDETRDAYAPVLWSVPPERAGAIRQMWFKGSHGDVGGHLGGWNAARGLSNIPLVWMLGEAEACGLALPHHWRGRYLTDPDAPSVGRLRGWGKAFVIRHRRQLGTDTSERVHHTARAAARAAGYRLDPEGAILGR